jgi:hypothetical protein
MEQLQLTEKPLIEILLDANLRQALADAILAEHGSHLSINNHYYDLALHCEATAEQLREVIHHLQELDDSPSNRLLDPLIFHPNMPDDLLLELSEQERFIMPLGHRRGPQWLLEKLAKEHRYSEAITTLALYYYGMDSYSSDEFKAFITQYLDNHMLRSNLKHDRRLNEEKRRIALALIEPY